MTGHDHPLVAFYKGTGTDGAGRGIEEVWQWDDRWLEAVHDFIQWLFPLTGRSRFNPEAPVLDEGAIGAFRADPDLQARVLRSLDLMLDFYGLRRSGETVEPGPGLLERPPRWLTPDNHNHLRLSRIVQSLDLLGHGGVARSLKACLIEIAEGLGPKHVSRSTLNHWRDLPP